MPVKPRGPRAVKPRGPRAVKPRGARAVKPRGARAVKPRGARAVKPRGPRAVKPRGARAVKPRGARAVKSSGARAPTYRRVFSRPHARSEPVPCSSRGREGDRTPWPGGDSDVEQRRAGAAAFPPFSLLHTLPPPPPILSVSIFPPLFSGGRRFFPSSTHLPGLYFILSFLFLPSLLLFPCLFFASVSGHCPWTFSLPLTLSETLSPPPPPPLSRNHAAAVLDLTEPRRRGPSPPAAELFPPNDVCPATVVRAGAGGRRDRDCPGRVCLRGQAGGGGGASGAGQGGGAIPGEAARVLRVAAAPGGGVALCGNIQEPVSASVVCSGAAQMLGVLRGGR